MKICGDDTKNQMEQSPYGENFLDGVNAIESEREAFLSNHKLGREAAKVLMSDRAQIASQVPDVDQYAALVV